MKPYPKFDLDPSNVILQQDNASYILVGIFHLTFLGQPLILLPKLAQSL
jgi:hypothetical protein